mgnify:CR=1 FL=1
MAIVKNECPYLVEWLAHHRCLGIDHFYIADNGSDDGTAELLARLHQACIVTLTHWPATEQAQLRWYTRALDQYRHDAKYLAFIDADEFITPSVDVKPMARIEAVLGMAGVGVLALEWRVFGSSGQTMQEPGLVIERFTHASSAARRVNRHVKSIVNPAAVERMFVHSADLKDGYHYADAEGQPIAFRGGRTRSGRVDVPIADTLRINHYVIKSEQEFVEKKMRRGRANLGPDAGRQWQYA